MPTGSPFVNLMSVPMGSWPLGSEVEFVLELINLTAATLTYVSRVLAGAGTR